jgi:hypothetical protein
VTQLTWCSQLAVHEEILRSKELSKLTEARFAIIAVATQYIKPHVTPFLHEVLADHVARVAETAELDLTTDPGEVRGWTCSIITLLTFVDLSQIDQRGRE